MHASAELLARLAPKIVSLDSQASGYGDLKPLDLAAALSGLPAGPYALARVAWVDDVAAWRGLVKEVEIRLRVKGDLDGACPGIEPAPSGHRPGESRGCFKPGSLAGVIALAAAEFCWPPSCRECFGRGEIKRKEYYGVCAACNGSGYGRVPLASLADACGVSGEAWKRVWAPAYERVYRLCSGWGREVLDHLRMRLSDEE